MSGYAFALVAGTVLALVAVILFLVRALEHARADARRLTEKVLNALLANEANDPAQAFAALETIREPDVPDNVTDDFLTRERLGRAKRERDAAPAYDEPRPIGMGG